MIIDCPICYGTGCYQGNGATCARCKGWGRLQIILVGPYGLGKAQTEDIETVYARDAKEQAERRASMTFDEFDAWQVKKRRETRLARMMDEFVPEWTLG